MVDQNLTVQQPNQLYSVPGFPSYIGSAPGGGGGVVTSVFGRVGAVVAQTGDYDSGQVTNASGVAGATVTAALNTLSASIAGLTSSAIANVSAVAGATVTAALNTLAAAVVAGAALVSNTAQGQAPQTNGIVGQALVATALGSTWSTNFQAQTLTTTGDLILNNVASIIRMGLAPGSGAGSAAATGDFRIPNDVAGVGWSMVGRNAADSADLNVFGFGSAGPAITIGGTGIASLQVNATSMSLQGAGSLIVGMLTGVRLDGPTLSFNNTVVGATITIGVQGAAGNTLTLVGQQSSANQGGSLVVASGVGSTATNSGALNLQTGTTVVMTWDGTSAVSATGDFRVKHGYTWSGRNQANSADRTIISWGIAANNAIVLGDTAASTPNFLLSTTNGFDLRFATTSLVRLAATTMNFQPGGVADFDVQLTASAMLGLHGSGTVRTIAIFGAASTAFQAGDKILFLADRTTAPTGNPTAGGYHWSETGGLPAWRTVAGDVVIWTSTTAATATAGGGAAVPATVSEFMTISFKGNVRKIPLFAN